jgi:hypothetical protein
MDAATESDMRVLPLGEQLLERLEELGFRRAVISKARYAQLKEDVLTLDFSGFPVYTHVNVPDAIVTSICSSLRGKEGKNPLARRRSPASGPHVSRHAGRTFQYSLTSRRRAFLRERGYLP